MQTKLLLYIIIGILVVAGGAGASLYFATKQPEQPPPIIKPAPPAEEVPPEEAPVDETADWKIFTNIFTNYQIKYPNNWEAREDNGKGLYTPGYLIKFSDPSEKDGETDLAIFSGPTTARGRSLCGGKKFEEGEKLNIGGVEATKKACNPSQTARAILIDFTKNDIEYSLDFYTEDREKNEKIFNQMLSTFKFIEKGETTQAPYINVISPNGGEQWITGAFYQIQWQSNNIKEVSITADPVPINGGPNKIITDSVSDTGFYLWQIPKDFPEGEYVISLYAIPEEGNFRPAGDISDNPFTISSG